MNSRSLRLRSVASALALTALSGCAPTNAVLELTLALPADARARTAVVQARRASFGFDDPWDQTGAVPLPLGAEPSEASIGILSDAELEEPLLVRVRYCASAACDDLSDALAPESRLRVERAFYLGERTHARWSIDAVPAAPNPAASEIARCAVRGCRDGIAVSYCRLDGTHFCE